LKYFKKPFVVKSLLQDQESKSNIEEVAVRGGSKARKIQVPHILFIAGVNPANQRH
jgi:hypothetical protein